MRGMKRPPASPDNWSKQFRRQVKLTCGDGWTVANSRGRMRLEVREGDNRESITLPYAWDENDALSALKRIEQIFKRHATQSLSLAAAAQGSSTASSKQKIDFPALFIEFRQFKSNVSDATWKDKYAKVLANAADCFKGKTPKDGTDICMKALSQWKQGSRSRQLARQNLYAFLKWGVQRGYLKAVYLPPPQIAEALTPKRVGYALSDSQILQLLNSLPKGVVHDRWRFAIQISSVFGVRPEGLRWLRIKDGPHGPELWSVYRKSKGGRSGARTEPRKLHPLLVRDLDGTPIDWHLQQRLQVGEQLPPLNRVGEGGHALGKYLRRLPFWQQLKAQAQSEGEELVPYAFRHRYAKASHRAGLPLANISASMGHTIQVHLISYARFTPDSTGDLYAKANEAALTTIG